MRKEDALISVFDHGFLYGDGVYETLRSYGSHIFLMREHLRRLYRSADLIGLTIPLDEGAWPPILAEAMQRNHVGQTGRDAYLRITISRGPGDIGLDPALCPMPTIVVLVKPLIRQAEHLYQTGVDLVTATIRRNHPSALSPQIKSLNFLNNILAKRDAIQAKAFDAIMLNPDGVLAECTTSNLFLVRGGRLLTPSIDCGILDGLTRNLVLQLARRDGIESEEGRFLPTLLREAEECFLTNTSSEILPVRSVDGAHLPSSSPGPVTARLRRLFQTYIAALPDVDAQPHNGLIH
ncbi:MAG: aminotransferase class IV [Nitrospiraceae bacterium]